MVMRTRMATAAPHPPIVSGGRAAKSRVMLVGHSMDDVVFGAERSLLEIIAAIDRQAFDVCCTFPRANAAYLREVARHTKDITVFPYRWWSRTRTCDGETVERFEQIFRSRA